MGWRLALQFLGTLTTAYVLQHAFIFATSYMKVSGMPAALACSFWNWLGLAAPLAMGKVLWGSRPWSLFVIEAGYELVKYVTMCSIFALWPADW